MFAWLSGTDDVGPASELAPLAGGDMTWSPPATAWTWGLGVPFESIRFAASNRLCVELGYHRTTRIIEPYSLRRSRQGNLILHALRAGTRDHRSYRIDQISTIRVTNRPFRPRYRIEFTPSGPLAAPPVRHGPRRGTSFGY